MGPRAGQADVGYPEASDLRDAQSAATGQAEDRTVQSRLARAHVRLVDTEKAQHWNSRGHFFAAAAEAMRRILVESARRKHRKQKGLTALTKGIAQSIRPELEAFLQQSHL